MLEPQAADAEPADDAPTTVSPQAPAAITGKRIILLSDGTGNSSGKLFKTNVWRIYQALDLGPGGTDTVQIANYDGGVGTSSFRPLAILGGVFGYGLKRNLLHMYRFLCRNYAPGDEIYAFGFSRGAFTIRLLVALIGDQGIVPYEDERDLARQSADAYRAFCRTNRANVIPWSTDILRGVRDFFSKLRRFRTPPYRPGEAGTKVRFVGVWDTVAAYGGPIVEITRAIDDWLWPMTMTDFRLGDHVETARHALALDDERDAFQPLLWDEYHERFRAGELAKQVAALPDADDRKPGLVEAAEIARARLQQVWFTGMHADVGGGYPDDSLSYVSLTWMMEHAAATGLTFMPDEARRISSVANSFGPIHDSRQGTGVYYRYQPRKIEALLHVGTGKGDGAPGARPMSETLTLRDPRVGEKPERPRGLLLSCQVHESVLARIASGTDNYAPIVLPRDFTVVHAPAPIAPPGPRAPLVAPKMVKALAAVAGPRAERQEVIWDWVWRRRWTYFVTLSFTMALVLMPWWLPSVPPIPAATDGRWVLGSVIGWLSYVLPGFARFWVDSFAAGSIYFLAICMAIAFLIAHATKQERNMHDATCHLWWAAMDPARPKGKSLPGAADSRLRGIRNARGYQAPLQWVKWRLLPNILGPAMILAILYAGVVAVTQSLLAVHERRETFCRNQPAAIAYPAGSNFLTREPCNAMAVTHTPGSGGAMDRADARGLLVRGQSYRITMDVTEPWLDGRTPADPTGLKPRSAWQHFLQWIGTPLRRIVTSGSMVPLIEVRWIPAAGKALPQVSIDALAMTPDRKVPGRYNALYTAPRTGIPYLFVNEAIFPDWLVPDRLMQARPTWFYTSKSRGNHGAANATIAPVAE